EAAPRHRARRRCRAPARSMTPSCQGDIHMKRNRSATATSLLAAGAVLLSACSNDTHPALAYAAGAKVECGGKHDLIASGSTAQANAMTLFIEAYRRACSGQTLDYTANGSGNGITDFLSGKTDFAGSDSPLSGDQ